MIPVPVLKYFPRIFQSDAKAIALASKIDADLSEWAKEILDMKRFLRPDECLPWVIDELGFLLNAGILNTDSDATKRAKVYSAIERQKYKDTWLYDAKLKIQVITGTAPLLYNVLDDDQNIRLAHEADDPDRYWGTMGKDDVDTKLGTWMVGDMTEYVVAGNIYIDLVVSTLTSSQLDAIEVELYGDCFPVYFRGYLGYVSAGVWNDYGRIIN